VDQARGLDPETTASPESFRYNLPTFPEAVERSVSLQDTVIPVGSQRDEAPATPSPVEQARGPRPANDSFWNDYIAGTPSAEPFRYNIPTPSPIASAPSNLDLLNPILDQTQRVLAKMEAMLQEFLKKQQEDNVARDAKEKARDEARDKEIAELKATIAVLSAHAPVGQQTAADRAKAAARAALEVERQQEMAELEERLKLKWEAAGLSYAPLTRAPQTDGSKSENPKADLVGILDPLPSHKEWTGQSVDANGHYLSFSKWLNHVRQVLAQKNTDVWKRAVLDVASLTCLRGRALDWWHALLPQQQAALREDFTLEMWDTLGKALHRNEQILRKEARDRKRQFGESLTEYAWKKTAMLQEAFGRNREAADVIADIKEGLTPADQEAIRSDLHSTPTLGKFMEELVRLDKIRGPRLKAALAGEQSRSPSSSRQQQRAAPYPPRAGPQTPRQQLSETYNPKELMFRPNPMAPNSPPQCSYKFPTGKIIFLSSPCSKCGGKHFNFECKKPKPGMARAAFTLPEESWDEFTVEPVEEMDEEDDLAVAYVAYMGFEPEPANNNAYQKPTCHLQITDQPWDEMAMKKEN
jgi:hypothetical protein